MKRKKIKNKNLDESQVLFVELGAALVVVTVPF